VDKTLVFARDDVAPSTITGQVRRGDLVRIASGVYSTEIDRTPEDIVREHMFAIVGRLLPEAIITDRSARTGGAVGGVLYVAHTRRPRNLELPGLTVRARAGAAPQPGDIPYPGGLYLASKPRGLAENCLPSRARSGQRRTLDDAELGDWIDFLCHNVGPERLTTWRQQAEEMAPTLGVKPEHLTRMQGLIGIALGIRPGQSTASSWLAARRSGTPVDQGRVQRFERLVGALRLAAPQSRPVLEDPARYTYLPFYEAYFSNFIEGTEFGVDEAARMVFDGEFPANRPEDAHDVIGTYRLVADHQEMNEVGSDPDEFIHLIERRNAAIMDGRPNKNPGRFKTIGNRAGATVFVDPELVEGTLRAGFRLRDHLDTAWERALYTAFVVAEVHPFDDGNGRTARVMMNAELQAGGQSRIIIPTVFRTDYLDGLRMLSRQDEPSVFIKAMRYAHDFTASVDFSDYSGAKGQLEQANAFEEPESAKRLRILGQLSAEVGPAAPWRTDA
jgi:hypothetical protein